MTSTRLPHSTHLDPRRSTAGQALVSARRHWKPPFGPSGVIVRMRPCYHSRYTRAFSQDFFGGIGTVVLRNPPVFGVDQLGWEVRDQRTRRRMRLASPTRRHSRQPSHCYRERESAAFPRHPQLAPTTAIRRKFTPTCRNNSGNNTGQRTVANQACNLCASTAPRHRAALAPKRPQGMVLPARPFFRSSWSLRRSHSARWPARAGPPGPGALDRACRSVPRQKQECW